MTEREELLARLEISQKACFDAGQHIAAMDIQSARAAILGVAQCGQRWIDQNYQIDRYGVALMMIREGCADPVGLARRILAEFGSLVPSTECK